MTEYLARAIGEITDWNETDNGKVINAVRAIRQISDLARKEGLLYLQNIDFESGEKNSVPLLQYLELITNLMIDGIDPEMLQDIGIRRLVASRAEGYEALICLIYLDGILSIQCGENPLVVMMKLAAMLPDIILDQAKKSCGEDDSRSVEVYQYFKGDPLTTEHPVSEKDQEEADAIKRICGEEHSGLEITEEGYFEIRLLAHSVKSLGDGEIRRLLSKVSQADLRLAMKGLSGSVNALFVRNMSETQARILCEDIVYMGPVRKTDVRDAARNILQILLRMADVGVIILKEEEISKIFLKLLQENDKDMEREKRILKTETELERLFHEYKAHKSQGW